MKSPVSDFNQSDRIVRFIYSTTINEKTKTLRASFVAFQFREESNKHELSCNHLEQDTIENLRRLGNSFSNEKTKYYGLGCISVALIKAMDGLDISFTPKENNSSHCDIYDNEMPVPVVEGDAYDALKRLRREQFLKLWNPFKDDEITTKDTLKSK